jgi:hypothetical protein
VDLNTRLSDDQGVFFRIDIRVLTSKPRSSKDDSVVEEPRHYVKEDAGLTMTGDIEGTVGYLRNSDPSGFVEGDHAPFSYRETWEVKFGGHACID